MLFHHNRTVIGRKKRALCLAVIALCSVLPSIANDGSKLQADQVPLHKEGLSLVWNDEFDVDGKPNPANWNFEYGFVRNQELQWYQPDNAYCKNGLLVIEGRKQKVVNPNYNPTNHDWRGNREFASFTSSCLITKGLQEWPNGGYYEVRAKIDTRSGSWPAIWLLGADGEWPDNGEIDVMEFYRLNDVPHILANAAWGTTERYRAAWDSSRKKLSDFTDRDPQWASKFHVWSMKWDKDYIKLYLDGELLNEIDLSKTQNPDKRNPFVDSQKFYLLLNLAIGSNGGTPIDKGLPLRYEVDYVRVYR